VTNDRSFVWTLQFLVGTVIAGLLLNIVAAYMVRAVDHVRKALPASYRRVRGEESVRIERLIAAATSDNALYAALAAEASRLRLHQLLSFFIAFVCISTLLFLVAVSQVTPAVRMTTSVRVQAGFLIIFLVSMGAFHYASGLENGRRARRLGIALRAVQRNRTLPIMD
jgi:hypothetical protein